MAEMKEIRGFAFALLGGVGWGFSGGCAQYLFARYEVSPLWISSVRMLCAGAVLCALALLVARKPFLKLVSTPRALGLLAVFSVFGLMACQVTYLFAIQNSNAGTATVIQYIGPVLVVLYFCVRQHRKPALRETIAVLLVIFGTFLLATHGNPSKLALTPAGLFWGLVSAVALALYTLIPRGLMSRYGSIPVVAGGLLLGGILLSCAIQSWNAIPAFSRDGWLVLFVGLVFFGTVVGFSFYFQAVRDIGAAKTGLVASIETVSATLFAVLWLGTEFVWVDLIGFVFIVSTVFVLAGHPGADAGGAAKGLAE